MNAKSREIACHHVELQDGCMWCDVYQQQSVRECDRCKNQINTDLVYLSTKNNNPQLICIYCNHDERVWG